MCGILGSINMRITPSLLDTIKHRGPDRQAIYTEEVGANKLYLAHTRLSIVDLSEAGNQPMVSDCGNYVLVFNGEIYNHLALRKTLRFRDFKGHSDTETLLHLLMEQGTDCIRNLNGIFGFAFWDKRAKRIIVARDPYGVKPLYYFKRANQLVFSSEIRPIRELVHPSLNERALAVLLNLRYTPAPYTLYKDIYKLRPGHFSVFTIKDAQVEEQSVAYISKVPAERNLSFPDAVEEYGKKLREAVERQLMGDVEMGVLLSGGVDSALVAGLAVRKLGRRMKAFTVGFDSEYKVNEIELAARTADYFGMEHHVIRMDANSFFDTFAECSRIVEEPLATTSFIPMYYLSKLASDYVKVVLTGQGADEPLGGYGRYQGEILRSHYPDILFKWMHLGVRLSGTKKETLIRGARSLAIRDDVKRFMNVYSLFTVDEINRLLQVDVTEDSCDLIGYFYSLVTGSRQSSVDKMMAVDLHMDLADDLLLYTDKITMNFSLECRVPMLDLNLVDFLQSLPTEYKVQRHKTKIVHKKFAESLLPRDIIERPKFGFQSPTDIWFRTQSGFIESTLLNGKLKDYLARTEISKVVEQHKRGYNREKQIFLLLSLNEWLTNNV